MCADKYPLRVCISNAKSKDKPVIKTEIKPADVATERQLRSDQTEHHYEIEFLKSFRNWRPSLASTSSNSTDSAADSSTEDEEDQQPPMAAAAVPISGDGTVFPNRFAGTEDGLDWLGKFELYCRYKGIIKDDGSLQCEPQIKSLLAVLLTDGAKMWFDSVAATDRDTWTKLRALFCTRFAEQKCLKFRHSREMFTTQQGQKEPVLEYISRIQLLARKSSDAPSVDVIIHAVMAGVKGYIAGYLAEKAPATIADLIKHASVAEGTLGDTEPVSASQLQKLQDDMKAQFEALSIKLSAGAVANVANERPRRVRFSPAISRSQSRSPSAERCRYSRLVNERQLERTPARRPLDRNRDYQHPVEDSRRVLDNSNYQQQPTIAHPYSERGQNNTRGHQTPRGRPDRYHWYRNSSSTRETQHDDRSVPKCGNCDENAHNDFTQCPYYSLRCLACSKFGHKASCCRSTGTANRSRGQGQFTRGRYERGECTSQSGTPSQSQNNGRY